MFLSMTKRTRGRRPRLGFDVLEDRLAPAVGFVVSQSGGTLTGADMDGVADTLAISATATDLVITSTMQVISSTAGGVLSNGDRTLTIAHAGVTEFVVNGNGGDDVVNLDSFDAAFTAGVTVSGGAGSDTIKLNGALTPAANRSISFSADAINLTNAAADLAVSGTGSVALTADKSVSMEIGSSVTTVNGNVQIHANQTAPHALGLFVGVDVNGGTVQTTGTGNVDIRGWGGLPGSSGVSRLHGVFLHNGAVVGSTSSAAGAGTITVVGYGAGYPDDSLWDQSLGLNHTFGVAMLNAGTTITSVRGAIVVSGKGAGGISTGNQLGHGVYMEDFAAITSTGTGANAATISVTGEGGYTGTGITYGMNMRTQARISTVDGAMTVTGIGPRRIGPSSYKGLVMETGAALESTGSGNVTLVGVTTVHPNVSNRNAIEMVTGSRVVASGTGSITFDALVGVQRGIAYGVNLGEAYVRTNNQPITFVSDSVQILHSSSAPTLVDAGTSTVTFQTKTPGKPIYLGQYVNDTVVVDDVSGARFPSSFVDDQWYLTPSAGLLSLRDAELDRVKAATIQFGDSAGGPIFITENQTRPAQTNLVFTTSGSMIFGAGRSIDANGGAVSITTGAPGAVVVLDTSGVDVYAQSLSVKSGNVAGNGIGSSTNPLRTFVDSLSTSSYVSGDQYIVEANDALLGAASAGTGTLNLLGGLYSTTGGALGNIALGSGMTARALHVAGDAPGAVSAGSVSLPFSHAVTINGTVAGTSYDQLSVSSINLNGALLRPSLGFVASAGAAFTIVDNTGASAVTGTFSGQTEGSTLIAGGQKFTVSYVGGTGNDVTLTKVAPATTFNVTSDATLSAALAAAAAGDVINVAAGAYAALDTTSTASGVTIQLQGNVAIAGTFSTKAADLVNLSGFTLTANGSGSASGNIVGAGGLVKATGGTLTLFGANTYTGGTTISAGTLAIGTNDVVGSIVGDVTNNGTLVFGRIDGTTFAGNISGTGAVVKSGGGLSPLILTGTNSYSGGTTVEAFNTLQIGAGGTTGSISGAIANAGTVVFNRSNTSTFVGDVTGGTINKLGAGTLTVTGNITLATTNVNNGTLQIGNGGATGTISGVIVDNSVITFNRTGSTSIPAISGFGAVNVTGGVTLTLTDASAYTGPTTIDGSVVTQSIANAMAPTSFTTVSNGGVLQLNGLAMTIGSLSGNGFVENGGASPATLTVGVNSAPSTTFSGVLRDGTGGGALALVKQLASLLTLSGTNTYSGGTTINGVDTAVGSGGGDLVDGGMLAVSSDANLGSSAGAINLNSFGALRVLAGFTLSSSRTLTLNSTTGNLFVAAGQTLTFNGTVTGGGGILKTGGGTLVLGGANTNTSTTSVIGGTLSISSDGNLGGTSAGIRVGAGGTLAITTGFTMSSTRAMTLGSAVSSQSVETAYVRVDPGQTLTFNGNIGQGNFADTLYKTGTGTLSLGGTNTFGGGIVVGQGLVIAASVSSLSNANLATSGVTVLAGATLRIATSVTVASLAGAGTVLINGFSTLTVGSNGASTTFSGVIQQGTGFGGTLTKAGSGTLTLTNTNTYSGATNVNAGILYVNSGSAIGGSGPSILIASGAALGVGYDLDQNLMDRIFGASSGALALTRDTSLDIDQNTTFSFWTLGAIGAVTYSGVLTSVSGAHNLGGGGGVLTVASDLANNGGFSVTVSGPGTVVLSQPNNFTGGITVNSGSVLRFANSGAVPASGSFLVNSGGTLATDFALDQAFLSRLSDSSAGVLALGANSANALDFTGYANLSLGAIGAYTYSGTLTPNGTAYRLGGGGGALVVSSVLADNGGPTSLTVANNGAANGTVALTNANTYTGNTTVNNGTTLSNLTYAIGLFIGNGGASGSILGDVTVNGTLAFNRSDASFTYGGIISGNGTVAQTGSGTTILTGASAYTGGTLGLNGVLQFGDGVTAGTTFPNGGNNANPIVFTATIAANPPPAGFNIAGLSRFRGTSTSVFKKLGPNTMSIGQGQNVYWQGTIDVEDGVLTTNGNGSALGDQTTLIVNGGTLRADFDSGIIQAPVFGSLSGAGGFFESGDPTPGLLAFGTNNASTSYAGVIQNGNGFSPTAVSSVVKVGTGTTTLTGANTYTGSTVVVSGGLQLGDGTNPGTLGGNVPISAITWSSGVATVTTTLGHYLSPGKLVTIQGETPAGYNGTFLVLTTPSMTTFTYGLPADPGGSGGAGTLVSTLYNNATFTFNEPTDTTIGTSLAGSGTFVKQGPAVLTLDGFSTQTGPMQVASGVLRVDGTFAGAGAVTVTAGGATLGGTGSINGPVAVNIADGRITAAGVGTIGTLTLNGGLTLQNGAIGFFDVTNVTTKDLIAVTGNIAVVSGTAKIAAPSGLADGIYTLMTYTGTAPAESSFTLTDLGGSAAPGHYTLSIGGGKVNLVVGVNVTSVSPFIGPTAGGNTVIITGVGFLAADYVKFGTTDAASFTINSATQITAVAPVGTSTIDVTVVTAAGTSATNSSVDDYTFATPTITSVVVNGGAVDVIDKHGMTPVLLGQQSVVVQLLVTFNMRVLLDANAFDVTSLAGSVTAVRATPSPANVAVTATGVPATGNATVGYTQYVLKFVNGAGVTFRDNTSGGGNSFTTLDNGLFQLNSVGSRIHASPSPTATGINQSEKFWSLYGVVNAGDIKITGAVGGGDDTLNVDGIALSDVYATFGSIVNVGSPVFSRAFDWDLDGDVDGIDLSQLYANFGTIWNF